MTNKFFEINNWKKRNPKETEFFIIKTLTKEIINNETDKEILSNFKLYCEAIKIKGLCEEASKINKDYEY